MTLTVTNCADFVRLTLGGPADAALPTLALVNMAGRHLVGMSQWRWLMRGPVAVGTVAAQEYVELPTDYGTMIQLAGSSTIWDVNWVGLGEITSLRAHTPTNAECGPFRGAVSLAPASGSTLPRWRVELYPTPSATNATAFSLAYRAQWTEITSESDYLPLPLYCETLFTRILQTFARGYMEEDQANLSERLAVLSTSPELIAATRQDRAKIQDYGHLLGAHGELRRYFNPYNNMTTITGP